MVSAIRRHGVSRNHGSPYPPSSRFPKTEPRRRLPWPIQGTRLAFFPENPGKIQTGNGNREELNGLEDGTALRTLQRRGKNKMKAQEFGRLIWWRLPRGE